jgi:hypothetical protein
VLIDHAPFFSLLVELRFLSYLLLLLLF